jgi:hypothetical protein
MQGSILNLLQLTTATPGHLMQMLLLLLHLQCTAAVECVKPQIGCCANSSWHGSVNEQQREVDRIPSGSVEVD